MRSGLHWYSYIVFKNAFFMSSQAIIIKSSFQKLAWHVKGISECMVLVRKKNHPMKPMKLISTNLWTSQVLVQDKYFSISALISSFRHIAVVIILLHHSFEKMGFSITYNTETFFSDEVDPWAMVTVLLFSVVFGNSKEPSMIHDDDKNHCSFWSQQLCFSQYLLFWVWQQVETLNCE